MGRYIWSGKEAALPSPPPLRTGRARFHAFGSSLHQRASRNATHAVSLAHTRLCLSTGGATSVTEERGSLCTWPLTFWFQPISSLRFRSGWSNITIFISTSLELTVLQTARPPTALLLAVVVSAHAVTTGECSPRLPLSPTLRTPPLPAAHAEVADC
jgi:hypothetical protein